MDKAKALQKLLNGTATKKEIELLKQALASGEISISGDVKHSIVITGNGNNISLTPEALNLLKPETTSEEPAEGEPPYMGLRYFDTSDADLFYGREALTRELLARVQKEPFLAIVGASGSGKSSVARAGLIPAWKKENERGAIHVITPTAHPLESLAASLTRESESVTATSTLMDDLKNDPRSLRLYVKKALGETKSLLLVDQFEETFTLCKDADERKAFIENLLSLADDEGVARVVFTLRADFYAHCAEYEGLRLALDKYQKYIGAMTPDELRQAITAPAAKRSAGWDFQPGLVDLILQDVGTEPGALPLLSHALLETWKRRQGHTLTLKGYADAGGVKKAIAQTAESVYDKLTPAEQTIARGIFLRLTELGEGMQDTRRRVKLDELSQRTVTQDSVAKVLKTLTDARLVTTEQNSAEVAHEALIREWGTLRKWLDEDRESLRLHRQLTESAREWERTGRDDVFLIHRSGRLDDAIALAKDPQYIFSFTEQAYLDTCLLLRDREAQEHERRLDERRQYKMLQVALEITEAMGSILDLEKILDKALEKLHLLFKNTNVQFLLYNKNENRLEFAPRTLRYYQVTNTAYEKNRTFGLDNNSVAGIVARKSLSTQKQEHIHMSNIGDDPDYLPLNSSTMSELCVSLIGSNNDLIGVIALERASTDGFNKNDSALVEIVARQLGLIFERAKLAENLTFKSAVATQSAWAVEVAHEVNNTVGSARNYLYLLREAITNNAEAQKYLNEVEKIIIEISNLGARKEDVEKEIILDDMLANYIGTLTRQMNIEFINQLNSQNVKVKINPKWLQQIVRHLIRNASQAMKNSGAQKILVRTEKLKDKQVEIIFQDYGAGVDEIVSSALFQRKITTKGKGGYGLLLVRQIVEDSNGIIHLLPSKSGVGATFSIVFPTV